MRYDSINLMLPTRRRLAGLKRFVHTAIDKADEASRLYFSFLVDADDSPTMHWALGFQWNHKHVIIDHDTTGPNLSRYYNRLYDESAYSEERTLVSMVADDMYFDSQGWDTAILNAVNARKGAAVVWCDDCYIQHEKMAVNLFTTRRVVDGACLGEFMWSRWRANMIDVVWTEIAKRTGIACYLPDVRLVHEHNSGKRVKDETHLRLSKHYTFAAGKWHILNPYIDIAVKALRENGVA